jgi:thiol:disulfide interchange protein
MLNIRHLAGSLLIVFAITIGSVASAMESTPFDQQAFEAAQTAGKPILIEVSAPWCPTCRVQAKVLKKLWTEARFKEFVTFEIDFDSQKDLLRRFNARVQSTLIVFKGQTEAGRSSGETDPAAIAALLEKAI